MSELAAPALQPAQLRTLSGFLATGVTVGLAHPGRDDGEGQAAQELRRKVIGHCALTAASMKPRG